MVWPVDDQQALVIEFEPRMLRLRNSVIVRGSMITYDERPVGIAEDVNGWKVGRANSNVLFWREANDRGPLARIKCLKVVHDFSEEDNSAYVVGAVGHELLHFNVPRLQFITVVSRVSEYHVISSIVPICLITLLVFPVFFIKKSDLQMRLQLLITLYLTLAAS